MSAESTSYQVVPMSEEQAAAISEWQYEPPYDIYGWLPWEHMKALDIEFANPELRSSQYVAVLDSSGVLCGFAQYFPMVGVTRLGLGMRPELCGHGQGAAFVRAIAEEARRRTPHHEIDLEVLVWNERAIKAYRSAGFRITDTYERQTPDGMRPFYCMVYDSGENEDNTPNAPDSET
ncbi:GNAT family N-acetyltransferase [Paenibacillus sp. P96]|uniref:GNAT family N-acetyltransferase n=1 Tax=Paenibacillus zeirhizosphaerae TaxID=2987519 RepID=A0ABT9FXQ2_9BACL|nr:GNAT family N-acetyltransferase [Paenibacillus sp. P96]MDP4099237.1 GNAT family N-acetyltransferase [Paenibacillus sp. P96]